MTARLAAAALAALAIALLAGCGSARIEPGGSYSPGEGAAVMLHFSVGGSSDPADFDDGDDE